MRHKKEGALLRLIAFMIQSFFPSNQFIVCHSLLRAVLKEKTYINDVMMCRIDSRQSLVFSLSVRYSC
jgi:hypothetical protein